MTENETKVKKDSRARGLTKSRMRLACVQFDVHVWVYVDGRVSDVTRAIANVLARFDVKSRRHMHSI